MVIYKREVKYHDKDDIPRSSVLEITKQQYIEFSMCNPDCQNDFNPKDGAQTSLHELWKDWHCKEYCSLAATSRTQILKEVCNSICDAIELEEQEYKKALGIKTIDDIDDDKVIALMQHLGISPTEAYEDIIFSNCYEYGNQEYEILTDDEAAYEEEQYVEQIIEDCYISELPKDSVVRSYINMSEWVSDWCNNRGENLASYDGIENEEIVNGTTYYIYRKN